jgi:hypothetical protein
MSAKGGVVIAALLLFSALASLPQDSISCRMLGRWPFGGGQMPPDLVNDTIAYVNAGGGMYILNVKDPANISKLGELQTPGIPEYFSVNDTFMCVGEYRAGVELYSIADLSRPRLLGRCAIPGYTFGTAFDGRYAYVACYDSGVMVVDFQNPANPSRVAILNIPEGASVLEARGGLLFVGAMYGGIRLVDISDPLNPSEISSYAPSGDFAQTFRVRDTLLYAAFAYSGLVILNISDPANPIELSAFHGDWYFYDLAISGSFAYAIIQNPMQIKVIDIGDPEHPSLTSTYRPPVRDLSFNGIAARGSQCYTVLDPSFDPRGGLLVIDVSDSAHPVLADSFRLPREVEVIATVDTLAFVGFLGDGLQVFSVADPSHISLLSQIDTVRCDGLSIDPPYVYGATSSRSFFQVLDVSDPRHPVVVGSIDTSGSSAGVAVRSGLAYLCQSEYLRIIDVSSPTHPVQVGRLKLPSTAFNLDLSGDYCYVADWYGGVQVVDISSSTNPQIVGSYQTPTAAAEDIAVRGQYAYYTDGLGFGGLDVSDPTHPQSVFYDWIPNQVWGMDATSKLLCVALLDSGVELLDYTSNPARPVVVGYYRTPMWATNVSLVDRVVYVADRAGFCILEYGQLGLEDGGITSKGLPGLKVLGTVAADCVMLELGMAGEESEVRVLDVAGRVRLTRQFEPSAAPPAKVRIDVSTLPAGTYFIEVRTQSERGLAKVLLAR